MHTDFKLRALYWANQFKVCCLLDSHQYKDEHSIYDWILAADIQLELASEGTSNFFEELKKFQLKNPSLMFGFFSYDLKNQLEQLQSNNTDHLKFPQGYFFIPKYIIASKDGALVTLKNDTKGDLLKQIKEFRITKTQGNKGVNIQARISKETYLSNLAELKKHIARGDIYEATYCQEFFSENTQIDPINTYLELTKHSPTPFATYFKHQDKFILSASPERFIQKKGNKVISQPIKGTAARDRDPSKDLALKNKLKESEKEQSENVMIVDLVRNDLTKIAKKGTVTVPELFGIYSFPTVHQMISTIECSVHSHISSVDIIKNCFPMGSMTGAPKISALELIEKYEATKRGVFSGSVGYISEAGDFDFNVIIRTILFNKQASYLSFQVGGAITHLSDPEMEYQECMLKATSIFNVLKKDGTSN